MFSSVTPGLSQFAPTGQGMQVGLCSCLCSAAATAVPPDDEGGGEGAIVVIVVLAVEVVEVVLVASYVPALHRQPWLETTAVSVVPVPAAQLRQLDFTDMPTRGL